MAKTTKSQARTKRERSEFLWGWLFILPTTIGLIVLNIIPIFQTIYQSFFKTGDFGKGNIFIGLQNYQKVFADKEIWQALINTFKYAIVEVPFSIVIALVLAVLLNRKMKGRSIYRTIIFLPMVAAPAAVAMVWRWLLNTRYGLVNIVLGDLGLPTPSWISDPKFIMISLIIVEVWSGIGYNTIILLAAIQGISAEMYESADLDGASGFQKFWKITLPLVSPSMFFLLTMGLMKAMRAFDMIYMFIGKDAWSTGGPLLEAVRTMVYGIYFNGFTRMDMGMASAESVVLFIMIMIVTGIQFKLQDKWVNYD